MKNIRDEYPELAVPNVPIQDDIVSRVLGREKSGYVRCFGIGPCPIEFATRHMASVEIQGESEKDEQIRQLAEQVKVMQARLEKLECLVEVKL